MKAVAASPLATHLRVVRALLMREMSTRYGRSAGGYAWAIAEPAGMVAMLALVFSAITHVPPLGDSFIAFFATGYVGFMFFRATSDATAQALLANKPLLRFPNVHPWDAILARILLQSLTNIAVGFLVLGTAFAWAEEPARLSQPLIAAAFLSATLMAAGAGTCNAVLFAVAPLWQRIFAILNRPLFLISGVFFLPEDMPFEVQEALGWNPLVHVISALRRGIYPVYHARHDALAFPAALGLILLLTGLILLRRLRREAAA